MGAMKKSNDRLPWWRGGLSIPVMTILYFIFQEWFPAPVALAASVGLVLLTFSLFDSRKSGYIQTVIVILLIALAVFIIATVFR
jgi:hypothetical protein